MVVFVFFLVLVLVVGQLSSSVQPHRAQALADASGVDDPSSDMNYVLVVVFVIFVFFVPTPTPSSAVFRPS